MTGRNLRTIQNEYSLDPWKVPVQVFKKKDVRKPIPTIDEWRIGMFAQLLDQRMEMDTSGENVDEISKLIDSLCSS